MKKETEILNDLKSEIKSILINYGAERIAVFGSFARGEEKSSSDLDILVRFKDVKSLLELAHIEGEIKDKIGRKVDLITENSVSPFLKEKILKEQKVILG
jgi:predicted nucleotidyltransferase